MHLQTGLAARLAKPLSSRLPWSSCRTGQGWPRPRDGSGTAPTWPPSAGAPRPARRRCAACAMPAHIAASGTSSLTPSAAVHLDRPVDAPPGATRGATTLMAAISDRAPLAPSRSISQAVFSVSSRAWSISILDSAICCLDHALAGRAARRTRPVTRPARPSCRAPARPPRWPACSGGCGRARAGPGRSRTRRPPRRAGSPPARARR